MGKTVLPRGGGEAERRGEGIVILHGEPSRLLLGKEKYDHPSSSWSDTALTVQQIGHLPLCFSTYRSTWSIQSSRVIASTQLAAYTMGSDNSYSRCSELRFESGELTLVPTSLPYVVASYRLSSEQVIQPKDINLPPSRPGGGSNSI
jgi:hypothetical protein